MATFNYVAMESLIPDGKVDLRKNQRMWNILRGRQIYDPRKKGDTHDVSSQTALLSLAAAATA